MRKITEQSINAFMTAENFKKGNMEIEVVGDKKVYMYLHSNLIASYTIGDFYGSLEISNAGWQSNTTKERLNGLPNVHINQKNFVWYLNGKEWNGDLTNIKNW